VSGLPLPPGRGPGNEPGLHRPPAARPRAVWPSIALWLYRTLTCLALLALLGGVILNKAEGPSPLGYVNGTQGLLGGMPDLEPPTPSMPPEEGPGAECAEDAATLSCTLRRPVDHTTLRRQEERLIGLFCNTLIQRRRPGPGEPVLALIIDDIGWRRPATPRLLQLPGPLTFAVFPEDPPDDLQLVRLKSAGHHLMVHLPMEPLHQGSRPLWGTISLDMSDRVIRETAAAALAAVPLAAGVNQHTGSLATADRRVMTAVLEAVGAADMFFIDSGTSPRSVVLGVGERLGVPCAGNDLFIDNVRDPEAIEAMLDRLVRLARSRGYAIGIGHPYLATAEALERALPRLQREGVCLVSAAHLVDRIRRERRAAVGDGGEAAPRDTQGAATGE